MSPRKSAQEGLVYMIGEPLDEIPAEVAEGIYLPMTRYRGFTTLGRRHRATITIRIKDRDPICEKLTIKTIDGSPVSAVVLREVPVAAMIRMSLESFSPFRFDGDERVPVTTQSMVDGRPPAGQRRRAKDETLHAVVDAYRRALANPETAARATQTVADELQYQRGYVSRLLSEARAMTPPLLGPAHKGKTGERRVGGDA